MYNSGHSLHVSTWSEECKTFLANPQPIEAIPAAVKSCLVDPIRLGDPVFCSAVCRELCKPEGLELCYRVLTDLNPSKRRTLLCEIIFCLCKSSTHDCRLFIASVLPALLWSEWVMGLEDLGGDGGDLSEDQSDLRIALLAAYIQDYNVSPISPVTRIISPRNRSIYQESIPTPSPPSTAAVSRDEVFPHNSSTQSLSPPTSLYPSIPLDRFDDQTRQVITYHLCRYFQDYLPEVDRLPLACYGLLAARLSVMGTKLGTRELARKLETGAILSYITTARERRAADRKSDLSLAMTRLDVFDTATGQSTVVNEAFPAKLTHQVDRMFFPPRLDQCRRRYPLRQPLALLWADSLAVIRTHYPILAEHVRMHLLLRSRYQGFPAAILALSI